MSRFYTTKKDPAAADITIAYGIDDGGWFYQEFNEDEDCIMDLDSRFSRGFGRGKLVELLENTTAPPAHIRNIALDLDPGDKR
ncbi:MAG: hypothetical protein EHM49_02080 [Deltaproteobacteria bacterium]|nr:MAG: hypothetical protein EHM49_02080 [Deltaproteobacteria bacterium]